MSFAGTRSFPISSEMLSRCVECRVIVLGARDPGRGRRGRDDRASRETDASPSFPLSQILDVNADDEEEEGAAVNEDSKRSGKSAVIKTSTRQVSRGTARERKRRGSRTLTMTRLHQTVFLPLVGLVPSEKLKPGDLIGVNKDSYLILDTLPAGTSRLFASYARGRV